MFYGTTPSIVSQYLYREFKKHKFNEAYVPFAGNFVVEQIVHKAQPGKIVHSTDVSLYSRAIGFGLTNQKMKLSMNEEFNVTFPHLANMKMGPMEKAALVIFLTEAAQTKKKGSIPYYQQLFEDSMMNQVEYFEKILGKVKAMAEELPDMKFYGTDACELIPQVKKGDLVFYDPPVLLGDYEKMFAPLEESLNYQDVEYTQMTDELKADQLQEMHDKGAIVYYRTNNPITAPRNFHEVFRYRYKWTGSYCIYANKYHEKFVGRFKPLREKPQNIPIITKEDVITPDSQIEIVPVSTQIGNHYRLMWTKKAQMTDAGKCYLVLIDKKLIGLVQYESGLKFGTDLIVLMSDPAAPTSQYKRLSRLILMVTCTEDMLKWFNDETMWPHLGWTTRVFTNNPVSMKYRGLFKLTERAEDKDSDYKYKLLYHKVDAFKTAQDGLKEWCKRYTT